MNILIIGCGYIGKAVASHWKSQEHRITATTRSPENAVKLSSLVDEVIILDGNDVDALTKALHNQEAVLLCVAAGSYELYEATYLDTAKTLTKVLSTTPQVKQVIYTGSTAVYGEHGGAIVTEKTSSTLESHGPQVLAATEQQLTLLASPERHVCLFRLGEIYGPDREITRRLRNLQGKALFGTGDTIANVIHRDEVVAAIDFALQHHLNGIYNLCNDIHLPRKELYEQICLLEGLPPVTWDPTKKRYHGGNKTVSNQKLKDLGFAFQNCDLY